MKILITSLYIFLITISFSQKEIHYNQIFPFEDGIAKVQKGKFETYINTNGNEILSARKQKELGVFGNKFVRGDSSFATVDKNHQTRLNTYFYFDTKGNLLFKKIAYEASVIKFNKVIFLTNHKYHNKENIYTYEICNSEGKVLKKYSTKKKYFSYPSMFKEYKNVVFFKNHFTIKDENKTLLYSDKIGLISSGSEFDGIESITQDIIVAYKYNEFDEIKYGLLDTNLNQIKQFVFKNRPSEFSSGLSKVKSNKTGLYGLINKKGKLVVGAKYESITDFIKGYAIVKLPNSYNLNGVYQGYRVIDSTGKELHWLPNKTFSFNKNKYDITNFYFDENLSIEYIACQLGFSSEIGIYNFITNTFSIIKVEENTNSYFLDRYFRENIFLINKIQNNKNHFGYVDNKMNWILINTEESEF